MTLSRRRLEFLEVLSDIVEETGEPVHYDRVGERLRVSKWTAYDMLQELMSDGLARASYSTSDSAFRGRSQVLFEPTAAGLALLNEMRRRDEPPSDDGSQETLASVLERARAAVESKSDLKGILSSLQDAPPLVFCASLLAVLIIEFKRRGLSLATVEAVLAGGIEIGAALPILIGIIAGELLVKGALKKVWNVDRQIERFMEEIQRMEEGTKSILAEFARGVMSLEEPA